MADDHFRRAVALEERIGGVPLVARTRYWRARIESATDAPAVRARGLVLEGEVRATGFLASEGLGDSICNSGYLYFYGDDAQEDADRWRASWSSGGRG